MEGYLCCHKCGRRTELKNNLLVGITLKKIIDNYYCSIHFLGPSILREREDIWFAKLIDQMRKKIGNRRGEKKIRNKMRRSL